MVEAAVSGHIAEMRKVWHSWEADATKETTEKHTIGVTSVVEEALLTREETRWIREKWLSKGRIFEVEYEQLVRAVQEGSDFLKLASFVGGVRTGPFTPTLKKLGRPLGESIENFDELAKACHEAGLGEFV